ncbi:MAG: AI-2E family transporter [Candidatus Moranbacteria bacterium]|nr:AI-2E family transporter [Candidatus Moranbacteria bacterium]
MRITTINISTSTILRLLLLIAVFIFVYVIFDILLLIFAAFVIVSAINPLVNWLERRRIPRALGTTLIYLLVVLGLAYIFSLIIPPIINQFRRFIEILPEYWEHLAENSFIKRFHKLGESAQVTIPENLLSDFSREGGLFSQAGSFVTGMVYIAVVFSLSFYMTIQRSALKKFIRLLTPKEHEQYVVNLAVRIQNKMGKWLQGQLFLNIVIGVSVYIVLFFLKVPFALVIALIAGVLEFIPTIGPVFSTLIAALVALTDSPVKAALVIIAFIVIQQLENHILVPLVMKQAVGLSPVVIIIALVVGAKLGGPIGVVLAVPFATALSEFLGDLFNKRGVLSAQAKR